MTEHEDNGYSEEKCVRCGWVMGNPPLNCNNDDTPHIFPSQIENVTEPQTLNEYSPLECFVAGSISTLRPFAHRHPHSVLPIARRAIQAINDFKPPNGDG